MEKTSATGAMEPVWKNVRLVKAEVFVKIKKTDKNGGPQECGPFFILITVSTFFMKNV